MQTDQRIMLNQYSKIESIYTLLMSYGIYRGTEMKVIRNDRWQEMILLQVDGKRIAVRKQDVTTVEVEILDIISTQ